MVTLPKITAVEHVRALVHVMELLERRLKLQPGTLKIELMVETPQTIFTVDGRIALPELVEAGKFAKAMMQESCNILPFL